METYEEWEAKNKARIEAMQKALQAELDKLIEDFTMEELEKRFFKNFGCINFRSDEFMHELKLARAFHDFHMRLHPEMHEATESEPYRCYHVTSCKCGFCESYDSSD